MEFNKIIIKSVEDLPKESGFYIVCMKDEDGRDVIRPYPDKITEYNWSNWEINKDWEIDCGHNKFCIQQRKEMEETWLKYIRWYLQPTKKIKGTNQY